MRTLLWDLVSKTAFWIPGLFEKTQEASPWAVSTRSEDSTALLVGLSAEVGGTVRDLDGLAALRKFGVVGREAVVDRELSMYGGEWLSSSLGGGNPGGRSAPVAFLRVD